ncbi:MAG: dockerin type I domain-containing protein, partial [Planctomycetota bacterium]
IAHEMGHIFWARDEYAGAGSWTDTRGYYNAQNLNAADNPTEGFEQQISIMRGGIPLGQAYDQLVSPESTLAMVGWRDSDGDGIFDFADVPLSLSGIGSFDSETSIYRFQGEASAVALPNQNSSGNQSDITLNEVTRLEYRIDDGSWQTASQVGAQQATLDVEFAIADPFNSIELRVIDGSTGVVSDSVFGARDTPALSSASILGFAYLDEDGGQQRDETEALLSGLPVTITRDDGSPLFYRSIDANDVLDDQVVDDAVPGLSFSADGVVSAPVVSTGTTAVSNDRVFESFDNQRQRVSERWGDKVSLIVDVAEPVGDVSVSVIGLDNGSYARVEALDASGNLIVRETSDLIGNGDASEVSVSDPEGRIRTVRVFGHAETDILISGVVAGAATELATGDSGQWQLPNLPDGDYRVSIEPELIIHQFNQLPGVVTVSGGTSSPINAAATRIDSALYNSTNAGDVNQDDSVSSLDALVIINDLGRSGARNLTLGEANGPKIDVNNDGVVSALDALLVINLLDDALIGEGEFLESGRVNQQQLNPSNADSVLGATFASLSSDAAMSSYADGQAIAASDRGSGLTISESVSIFGESLGELGRSDAHDSAGDVDQVASIARLNTDSLDVASVNGGESAEVRLESGVDLVSLSSELDQEIKEPFGEGSV